MLPIFEAFDLIDKNVQSLKVETVPVAAALNQVLAENVYSKIDLPPFTQTAVDGYAVAFDDLQENDELPVVGEIAAGAQKKIPVLIPNTATRIFTGGYLPTGADTVIRQEYVQRSDDQIKLVEPVEKGADIRYQAEELTAGTLLANKGEQLTAARLASLSMAGVAELNVFKKPKIAVLVTGNEVTAPGKPLQPGQVYDANGVSCKNFLSQADYEVSVNYIADSLEEVTAAIEKAFSVADVVVTTGGVSVGEHDYIPQASKATGGEPLFWKVAQMPGKPLFCAQHPQGWLIGLPGNPAAVVVNLHTFVLRLLQRLQGFTANLAPVLSHALVGEEMPRNARRDRWQRVVMSVSGTGQLTLNNLAKQGSHMLSNTGQANAIALIPAGSKSVMKGEILQWLPLR